MKDAENRGRAMGALRAASIAAALLALAGLALPFPTRARTVTILIDASDSIGSEGIEASRSAALSLIRELEPRDRAAVMAFAGKTALVAAPLPPAQAAAGLESATLRAPSPESTDLSAALSAARDLAAKGPGSRTVYVFSDGRANAGRSIAESLLPLSSSSSRRVVFNAVPEGRPAAGLVSEGLGVPELAHPGERLALSWKLLSADARELDYRVLVDGTVAARGKARVSAGENEIALAIDAGPTGRHAVLVESGEARSGAYVDVGGEARVLVVSESRSPIASALRAQGMNVETGGAEALPEDSAGYEGRAAVVLDDLPALAMTEGQQARLQDFVAGGGGLLVVGGQSSLGRGEYYATPLEDMLPVETDSRQRLLFTRAKLLFIIDHSGSMSEKVGSATKQMIAMRGVAASISELNPLDEVGIIGFDSSPTWVLPFTPATEREKILASISNLGEGGGTDLSTAIQEALRGFGEPGPTKRHAIILTDGLTPDNDFRGLSTKLSAAGVTVSTIAIGDEVNESLLRSIAEWCGGKYYRSSTEQIPTIIDKETVRMTRDLIQEGRIETRIPSPSAVVEGLGDPLPAVGGYLLTKAKSLATVQIEARGPAESGGKADGSTDGRADGKADGKADGSAEAWDPLLSTWRYGNGMVAVFASDSGRRWLSSWSGTSAYNRLWSQALRSVERAAPDARLRASATMEGGNAHIVVEAMGADRRSMSSLHLVGGIDSAPSPVAGQGASYGEREAFSLEETAPGRYEGYATPAGPGLSAFDILDPVTGAKASAWAWSPPGPESAQAGPDESTLSLIALSTGGRLLSNAELGVPPASTRWNSASMRLPLLALAALLLVVELYLRSTMTGQIARAKEALLSWWSSQRAIAESVRSRRWPQAESRHDEDSDKRYMESQRKLAEHVQRRYVERMKAGGDDD